MSEPKEFDLTSVCKEPHAFIQWKGTDVCMDFRCDCGESSHYDGMFAYAIKCGGCGQLWEMPSNLFPRKVKKANSVLFPIDEE